MNFWHAILHGGIWPDGVSGCRRALGARSVWLCGAWMVLFHSMAAQGATMEVSRTQDAAGGVLDSASYQSVVAACQGQPASVNGSERLINKAGFICTLDFLDAYRFGSVAATCDAGGGGVEGANGVRYAALGQGQPVGISTNGRFINHAGFLCDTDVLDSPLVGAFLTRDARGFTNEVTDGAWIDGKVEVQFTIYHQMGMKLEGSSFDLIGPAGETICSGQSFGGFMSTNQYGLRCGVFTAAVSKAYPADLGTYYARVSAISQNGVRLTNCEIRRPSLHMFGARLKNSFSTIDDDVQGPGLAVTNVAGSQSGGFTTGGSEILLYNFDTSLGNPRCQPTRKFVSVQSVSDLLVHGLMPRISEGISGNGVDDTGWNGDTNYWEFTVTMLPGYLLDLQKIAFASLSSYKGPTTWALRSSRDGYSAVLATGALATNSAWTTIMADLASSESESPVTYRLYGSGGHAGYGWAIDDLSLTGRVAVAPGAFIVTDGDLNSNAAAFQVSVQDAGSGIYGITHSTRKPTWSLASSLGVTNGGRAFTSGPGDGGGKVAPGTLSATGGFPKADIVLGVYTATVQATDYDVDRPDDHLSASTSRAFTVMDDDQDPPLINTTRGIARFDGKLADSTAQAVIDSMLTNGLSISNRVIDLHSGLLSTSVQFRVQDPEGWDGGQVDFSVRPGDGGAKTNLFLDAAATSVAIDNYDVRLTNGSGRALGVWTCTFYAVDFDDDRSSDAIATNVGITMLVKDDDMVGPRMTNVQASGVTSAALIATGFEALDGWSWHDGTNWTQVALDGMWTSVSTYVNPSSGRGPEGTPVGYCMVFDAADDSLQLPPVARPGWLTVWARNNGTNGAAEWVLERLVDGNWTSLGTRSVAGTSYGQQAWLVDDTNSVVSLRLRMTAAGGSIYFDDLVVVPHRPWRRDPVEVSWAEASDQATGNSGLGEYRQIPAGSPPPLVGTNGVSLGQVRSCSFEASRDAQGIATGYAFAVDADMDRGVRDRAMGLAIPVIARWDITPPTMVPMLAEGASTEGVDDPTTQFDLSWDSNNVGPDDPERDDLYPTWTNGNRNLLSPWKTYKVYYGPYDPEDVPIGDPGHGNGNAYIYTNFIATGAYSNDPTWKCVESTNLIADPGAAGANYEALGSAASSHIRLYDLDYDQHYAVVMVGVDEVGNEGAAGPASWATNNTIRFSLIRGKIMEKGAALNAFPGCGTLANTNVDVAAALYWIAAGSTNAQGVYTSVSKDYDLIYWDSDRFRESTNNHWQLLGSVRTNWFVDDGGQFRPRGQIRFFRASYKDRWRKTRQDGAKVVSQRPLASEEVYALHNVVLSGGQNFVALHGVPYTNTFQGVFGGLENFPGGSTALPTTGTTLVEFYAPGIDAPVSSAYWLNSTGRWIEVDSGLDVTTNVMDSNFFGRGFSITLPRPLPTNYVTTMSCDNSQVDTNGVPIQVPAMVWSPIMQVPTNGFSQIIQTGGSSGRVKTNMYNLATLRLPVSVHPSEMRLIESGFTPGIRGQGDEIYTINTATKGVLSGSTIYCDANLVWRFVASNGLVPAGYFKPNDVIVIVSRNGGVGNSWTWTYSPTHFYTLPTRWMGH